MVCLASRRLLLWHSVYHNQSQCDLFLGQKEVFRYIYWPTHLKRIASLKVFFCFLFVLARCLLAFIICHEPVWFVVFSPFVMWWDILPLLPCFPATCCFSNPHSYKGSTVLDAFHDLWSNEVLNVRNGPQVLVDILVEELPFSPQRLNWLGLGPEANTHTSIELYAFNTLT